jgi:hypothetical protein
MASVCALRDSLLALRFSITHLFPPVKACFLEYDPFCSTLACRLSPGRIEILVRKSITLCGLLLARRQTARAKWIILKEICFKTVTGMTPLQYQKELRLREARHLMGAKALSATEAAFAVGYESSSQFSREFARLFGMTPRQIMAQRRVFNPN